MLSEGSEPNILELEKLVASLCQHLREAKPGIDDPKISAEVSHYLKILEDANKNLVTEYTRATKEYEEALGKMKDTPKPAAPAAPETPKPPPEEDVLPIGLALRDQLLKRFGAPPKAVAAPAEVGKDVWQDLTASEEEQAKAEKATTTKETMPAGTPAFDADVAVDDDEVAEKPGEKARKPARPQPPTTPPKKKPSRPDEKKEIWDTGISEVGE
jgi:hypothetical protein